MKVRAWMLNYFPILFCKDQPSFLLTPREKKWRFKRLKRQVGFNTNAQDVMCFMVCVCVCVRYDFYAGCMQYIYMCGRPHCCVSVCTNEWADKCMHGNVFRSVRVSLCVYTNIYLLFQVLSWTYTGWIWPLSIVQNSKQAKDHENCDRDQFSHFPFLLSPGFPAWPFSLWPKTELIDLHWETSPLQTLPHHQKYNEETDN